jgi:glycopeptide antibiotics resistance protein
MIFAALALLLLMVSLLLAIPFGTVIYLAEYADFNRAAAAATLSFAMALKLGFSVLLVLAHQRFLENKGLVLIVLTSFAGTILLSFLHGFFPRFLVSITDDVGAIIIAVLTLIWALFYLIGAIPAILKALRVDKSAA